MAASLDMAAAVATEEEDGAVLVNDDDSSHLSRLASESVWLEYAPCSKVGCVFVTRTSFLGLVACWRKQKVVDEKSSSWSKRRRVPIRRFDPQN